MKQIIFFAACFIPLLWTACGGDKPKEAADTVPKGMVAKELKPQGLPLKINIPDSTFGLAVISETPEGVEVKVGALYDIIVNSASAEESDAMKYKPIVAASDELPKKFTDSSATDLRWEINLGDRTLCHFYHIVKIDNTTYYVRDNMNNTDNEFKKENIDKMLISAKSLRAIPPPAPKS
ncbi:MAG: hypothetical protein HY064_10245 [Bacteroidetes bacterium]|nr:hypothetical protein [Bacteroidota bacterium]